MSNRNYEKRCYCLGGAGKAFSIAGFDFETDGLGGDLLYATYCREGRDETVRHITGDPNAIAEKMIDVICANPEYVWFAHNAQYDWRYFIPFFKANRQRVKFYLRMDNAVFMVQIELENGEKVVLRDSYAIWSLPLKDLAKSFCPEFPKLDLNFDNVRFDPNNEAHRAYAARDTEILVKGLRRYNDLVLEHYGVNLGSTTASTAMRAWERMLPPGETFFNPLAHEKFIRRGYFGGLVFLTNTNVHKNVNTYDLNSSYPFQMRKHGVPYGRPVTVNKIMPKFPGFYDITVKAPNGLRVPILPMRDARGMPRWPCGVFRTVVSSIEIAFALEHGYEIVEVHEGVCFQEIIHPFDDFVTKAETIRTLFKGKAEEIIAKLRQTSVYGKFGSKKERLAIYAFEDLENLDGCIPWDDEGNFYIKTEENPDMICLPQWSAWITACARLHLLDAVYNRIGVNNVIYGDTDSITCYGELPTGKKYGDWKLEKKWKNFRAIAPKVYAGQLESNGDWCGAAKGIPSKKAKGEIFRDIFDNGITEVSIDTLPSFMVTFKGKKTNIVSMKRRSTDVKNSKNWVEGSGGTILPRRA